jgi:UDP-N-acetylmuramyl tripeptide synthase
MRDVVAIWLGRLAGLLSRLLGRGGGTTMPGVIARRVAPHILTHLTRQLSRGVICVAGTNGKTTTTRMIADTLVAAGWRVLHNRSGANLTSGVTATVLMGADWRGRVAYDVALFECDEAALPQIVRETQPRLVVLHNLFRDQLDRYGEVDTIANNWAAALHTLPTSTVVLYHADDPSLVRLANSLTCRTVGYGNDDVTSARDSVAHLADAGFCRCGAALIYSVRFYAHIGHYHCPNCDFARPQPAYALTQVTAQGLVGSHVTVRTPHASCTLQVPLPGLYNATNALATYACADQLGVAPVVAAALAQMQAAFGRYEVITAGTHQLVMALIKNPVGASETIRMLVDAWAAPVQLLIIINDRDADGTDVSWLWDADFERLCGTTQQIIVSGTRAADMQVRMQYAGVDRQQITRIDRIADALDATLAAADAGQVVYVLPTYTAMLELRAVLTQRGWVAPFWQD